MTPRAVSVDAIRPQPWRNGGGLTRELLAWPTPDTLNVRLSVADTGEATHLSTWIAKVARSRSPRA